MNMLPRKPHRDDAWNEAWKVVADEVDATREGEKLSIHKIVDALDRKGLIHRDAE